MSQLSQTAARQCTFIRRHQIYLVPSKESTLFSFRADSRKTNQFKRKQSTL